jgi:hypothetical protein
MTTQSPPWSLILILIPAAAISRDALCANLRAREQECRAVMEAEKVDSEMVTRQAICR